MSTDSPQSGGRPPEVRRAIENDLRAAEDHLVRQDLSSVAQSCVQALMRSAADSQGAVEVLQCIRSLLHREEAGVRLRDLFLSSMGNEAPGGEILLLRALFHHLEGEGNRAVQLTAAWIAQWQDNESRLERVSEVIANVPDFVPAYLLAAQVAVALDNTDSARNLVQAAASIDGANLYTREIADLAGRLQPPAASPATMELTSLELATITTSAGPPFQLLFRPETWDRSIAGEVIGKDCYRSLYWQPGRAPRFIVDVGAHIGCFATWMGARYPDTTILAFEMLPENGQMLFRNTSLHPNVVARCMPFGGEQSPVAVHPCAVQENTGGGWVEFGAAADGSVACGSLPAIFEEFSIDRIDLLKLDCEGSEFPILQHAISTGLIERIDTLTMELHLLPDPAQGRTMETAAPLWQSFPHVEIEDSSEFIKMVYAWR